MTSITDRTEYVCNPIFSLVKEFLYPDGIYLTDVLTLVVPHLPLFEISCVSTFESITK